MVIHRTAGWLQSCLPVRERQMEISLLLAATQLWATVLLFNVSITFDEKQKVCVCKFKKWIKSFNWYWYKETRSLNDESHYVFPFNHRIIWIWSLKKCLQHSSLDSVPVTVIHFPTGGCINLPPHSFHWYSFKWVSSLPPYKYAWELLSFGIEWAWSLCDSLCSCVWNIGIGMCYAICVPVSEWGVCVCVYWGAVGSSFEVNCSRREAKMSLLVSCSSRG